MITNPKHLLTCINISGVGPITSLDNMESIDSVSSEYNLQSNSFISSFGSVTLRRSDLNIAQGEARLIEVLLDWGTVFKDICYTNLSWDSESYNTQLQFTSMGIPDIDIGIDAETAL